MSKPVDDTPTATDAPRGNFDAEVNVRRSKENHPHLRATLTRAADGKSYTVTVPSTSPLRSASRMTCCARPTSSGCMNDRMLRPRASARLTPRTERPMWPPGQPRWTEIRGSSVTLAGRECRLVTLRDATLGREQEAAGHGIRVSRELVRRADVLHVVPEVRRRARVHDGPGDRERGHEREHGEAPDEDPHGTRNARSRGRRARIDRGIRRVHGAPKLARAGSERPTTVGPAAASDAREARAHCA